MATFGLTLIHCPLGYVIFTIPPFGPPAYTIAGFSGSATIDPNSILVGELGIRLTVEPTAGNPPFDNYYVRGWHAGVETVSVHIRFDIPDPPVGGTLTLLGIVVE